VGGLVVVGGGREGGWLGRSVDEGFGVLFEEISVDEVDCGK